MMRARIRWGWALLVSSGGLLLGCGSSPEFYHSAPPPPEPVAPVPFNPNAPGPAPGDPLFEGRTVQAEHTAPVIGGTLLVTRDGSTIVAVDPDRDAVFLVDSVSHAVRTVSLSRGDEPGRIAEGANGTLFVALRRAGAVVQIDARSSTVLRRIAVCASPRGVAYDAKRAAIHIACRSGQLISIDTETASPTRTLQLDPDLRDVIVREHDLLVTRFMSAEVLLIADDGSVSRRARPQSPCGDATVLYRALPLSGGKVALAHQVSSNDPVGEGHGGYGSSSCGIGLVGRLVTTVDPETPSDTQIAADLPDVDPQGSAVHSSMTFESSFLVGAGPLDIAFDASETRMASISFDHQLVGLSTVKQNVGTLQLGPEDPRATLWLRPWDASIGSPVVNSEATSIKVPGQPVAVAFSAAAQYIVQSREPATLELEDGTSIPLSAESHDDSGHRMFHMNSGLGIACASCHPEGGDDGHAWRFPEGLRRTMPLEGGVLERAPFHWDGTLADMNTLVSSVMVNRMGLPLTPTQEQVAALGAFLEQLPELPPAEGLDAAAVARGEAIFRRADVACASCHSGPQFTDNRLADVGTGGSFVTPTLLGVGLRPALFHDGCAKSINERFGVCGGSAHGKPELLSAQERADLITFLRSL